MNPRGLNTIIPLILQLLHWATCSISKGEQNPSVCLCEWKWGSVPNECLGVFHSSAGNLGNGFDLWSSSTFLNCYCFFTWSGSSAPEHPHYDQFTLKVTFAGGQSPSAVVAVTGGCHLINSSINIQSIICKFAPTLTSPFPFQGTTQWGWAWRRSSITVSLSSNGCLSVINLKQTPRVQIKPTK